MLLLQLSFRKRYVVRALARSFPTKTFVGDKKKIGEELILQSQIHGLFKKTSLGEVKKISTSICHVGNETVIKLAALGNEQARAELLKRHIMDVESIEYLEASKIFDKIAQENKVSHWLSLPNKIGVIFFFSAAFISMPLVFHLDTALWFNELFVTADIPEPKDLETWLETGSWTWLWMEPLTGQLNFFLIALGFARMQFKTLGIKPYSTAIKEKRAQELVTKFPQYDPDIVKQYSMSKPFKWSINTLIRKIQGLE